MCTIFTGFLYVKSLVESNNVVKGMAVFRTSEDGYDEVIFKKFCGGDDRGKNFHVGDGGPVRPRMQIRMYLLDWYINKYVFSSVDNNKITAKADYSIFLRY